MGSEYNHRAYSAFPSSALPLNSGLLRPELQSKACQLHTQLRPRRIIPVRAATIASSERGDSCSAGIAASIATKVQSHAICSLNLPFSSRNTYRTLRCCSFYKSQCIFPLNMRLFGAVLQRRLQSFLSALARQSMLKYEA
jgi:hypothetical protein